MNGRGEGWKLQASQYALFTLLACAIAAIDKRVLHVNQTTVALSFLILILFTAFRRRLAYSIYLSLLCTLLYNYYFLPPFGSLTIADPQNLIALTTFLVAAVSVNHISAKERRQAEALATHQSEVEKLYAFSQRMLMEERLQELTRKLPAHIAENFQMRAVALYLPEQEMATMWDPENLLAGMENLQKATQAGEVSARSSEGIRIVPLMLGMRAVGALAMVEGDYSESFYDAISGLTAVSIERAAAIERNNRIEAAREGELLRSALLDSMTHELRTPLTGIRMAATTLLEAGSLDETARLDLAAVISEESARLDRLIDEAVIVAQLGAGEVHLRKEPEAVGGVIDRALGELRGRMRGREIQVEVEAGMAPVAMDADLMRRVWKHLVENALQYSPAGSPVRLAAKRHRGKLWMAVTDRGSGIAEEEQPLIFERFFRGANSAARVEGTGMGLAIVKAILEAHGGGISVQSAPGQGTVFSFWIPAEAAAAEKLAG